MSYPRCVSDQDKLSGSHLSSKAEETTDPRVTAQRATAAEPPRIPRIPGAESARGCCPFLHRPGPGAMDRGQPAQKRRRPPGPGPGAGRQSAGRRRRRRPGGREPAWQASRSARRCGSERVPAGTGGGRGCRSRIPGPAPRSRAAPQRLPARPRPGKEAAAGVNPWRGGAGGAEPSRAEQSRKRPGREAGEAAALRGGGRGLGARPPSPPSPLPSARCAERGAREAPVTAARASAASSAVRGGGSSSSSRRGPAQLSGPGAEKAAEMMPMILTVFLSNNEQILTEVPITPETTCRDVVEFCKEPGEGSCHLAEVWRGNERPIPFDHMMYDHLQKWGPRREEVKFFLRHEESPAESNEQSGRPAQNQRNGINIPVEKRTENGVGNPRVELTLSELQDMAARQQQQIENQQQMLVAKEQRLRYLKQQERRQQQSVSESEKLQKLKERVETQETKLKKIRAMRGQVDYSKMMNGNLSTEIEHISAMFQEKQQELQAAVLKVDQLTQQLEDLRKGKLNGFQSYNGQMTGPAAIELKKLYQELQIRNRLNQEQNSKLQQQKELLNKRNMEVAMMDKRINELRERLYKKKVELNRINGTSSPQSSLSASGRVAAVGPYIQVPSAGTYAVPVDPVKPQSLTIAPNSTHGRSKSETDCGCVKKSPDTWKVSDLDIIVDPILSPPTSLQSAVHNVIRLAPTLFDTQHSNDGNWPILKQSSAPVVKPPQISNTDWKESSMDTALKQGTISSQPLPTSVLGSTDKLGLDLGKVPPTVPGVSKQLPQNYGTYPSPVPLGTGSTNSLERRKDGSLPRPGTSIANRQRPVPLPPPSNVHQPSSSQQIQQRISVPPSPTYQPSGPPLFPGGEGRPELPLTVAIRPFLADKGSRPQSPRKGPQTVNSSSIYSVYLQQATPPKNYQQAVYNTLNKSVKAVYGKPVLQSGSTSPSPLPFLHGSLPAQSPSQPQSQPQTEVTEKDQELENAPPPSENSNVENIPRPLSPTKLTPIVHSPLRYQSDADLEALRRKLANAPRPLKKRSSITEPEGPSGPNIQKLLYQRFNTLAGGIESAPFYQPSNPQDFIGNLADVDNGNASTNGNIEEPIPVQPTVPVPDEPPPSSDANDNELPSPATEELISTETTNQTPETTEDNNNNLSIVPSTEQSPSPTPEVSSPVEDEAPLPPALPPPLPPTKRTNLKKPNSERTGHGLRVKFNPLALLLDASLEGEFDLVQRIIYEVDDPSKPNDEGITPLHNAVCAGHHHIVKFLLDFGVNVNAADSDGWTPLHCAASCNSVHLCKLLVESGAAIFASTISDIETAADKCEEMEEGYIQCSQFLYGVQEKLGVMNKGVVYALWDYEAQNNDELSFHEGDAITILRRKDDNETEWWWARLNDKEGYVPKNLLGLYPRIKPRQRTLA
ncbi:apoptosis-stimulating of p53 protein 1 isoform X2 [Onychostruthus taczanowskii]|uniref:apoptosis-stimulating of p53 protein 1 isoform X2 n=1 Tax=Onychostruthus taczanowskii TaxID=356909 RepID=UPI001B8078AA|nr:apoptosis-stimulating of p53 protein 1 isoform X2 [Onychostruthus taczanowskii]